MMSGLFREKNYPEDKEYEKKNKEKKSKGGEKKEKRGSGVTW